MDLLTNGIRRIEKPWGYELIWAHTPDYVGKVLHINAGQRLSLQYHEKKEETLLVIKGSMELLWSRSPEDPLQSLIMNEGDRFHVPTGLVHRMIALHDTDVAEVSTPHLDDVIRLQDVYGR